MVAVEKFCGHDEMEDDVVDHHMVKTKEITVVGGESRCCSRGCYSSCSNEEGMPLPLPNGKPHQYFTPVGTPDVSPRPKRINGE